MSTNEQTRRSAIIEAVENRYDTQTEDGSRIDAEAVALAWERGALDAAMAEQPSPEDGETWADVIAAAAIETDGWWWISPTYLPMTPRRFEYLGDAVEWAHAAPYTADVWEVRMDDGPTYFLGCRAEHELAHDGEAELAFRGVHPLHRTPLDAEAGR